MPCAVIASPNPSGSALEDQAVCQVHRLHEARIVLPSTVHPRADRPHSHDFGVEGPQEVVRVGLHPKPSLELVGVQDGKQSWIRETRELAGTVWSRRFAPTLRWPGRASSPKRQRCRRASGPSWLWRRAASPSSGHPLQEPVHGYGTESPGSASRYHSFTLRRKIISLGDSWKRLCVSLIVQRERTRTLRS